MLFLDVPATLSEVLLLRLGAGTEKWVESSHAGCLCVCVRVCAFVIISIDRAKAVAGLPIREDVSPTFFIIADQRGAEEVTVYSLFLDPCFSFTTC